ncbi:MAG: helix-turn-helix domain-containing protein [Puniceicoccaceae bacterium]
MTRLTSPIAGILAGLFWLLLAPFLNQAEASVARPVETYQVDPLSEKWRWQRVEGLEGENLEIVKMGPDDRLGIVSGTNELKVYDGLAMENIDTGNMLGSSQITAFGISSKGVYCIVTTEAIFLLDKGVWNKVSDVGLARRVVSGIMETADGILWAGTNKGVARIDPNSLSCTITPIWAPVISVCESPDRQSLWVNTGRRGKVWERPLLDGHLDPSAQWKARFKGWDQDVLSSSLLRASDGKIWFINNNHNLPASFYDPTTTQWETVNLSGLGGDNFDFSIIESRDGAVWISSRGSLHVMKNGRWEVYHSPEYPVPGARSTLFEDSKGHVYLAEASGMSVRIDYSRQQSLSFNNLHFQAETTSGDLLFISIDDEVVRIQQGQPMAAVHRPEETGINAPGALIAHSNGDWILAGSHDRQAALSIWDGSSWTPYYFPETSPSFGHLSLMEHSTGDIWVGCAQLEEEFPQYEGGIVVLRPTASGNYTIRKLRPPDFSFRNWSLNEAPDGQVVTGGSGLLANTLGASQALEVPDALLYKWLDQVAVDNEGNLWIALWSFGVFHLKDNQWTHFNDSDGLGSPLVSYIISLDGKDPVATTREGHFRFDGTRWAPYMASHDGLHRGSGRVVQAQDGSLWINHTHVDWYYRGQRAEAYSMDKKRGFRTVQYVPDTIPPETSWATLPPELTRSVNLSLQWTGRDAWSRSRVDDLHFSYRLDKGPWSPFLPAREIRLNDLKGGRHEIEVRARDSDFNIDPTPLKAEFTVLLPLWEQGWFIASVIGAILFLIAVIILFVRQRVKHLLEIEQVKMRFFTHLSHEIKTPLSLILGPVERLQNEVGDSRHQHYLHLIKSNSQRLLFLINQLLDFRKFQLEKLEFKPETGDFIPFVRSCVAVFEGWAQEKGHELKIETDLEHLVFAFDQEMFHKIIDNMVNNAVKYTQPGGKIHVRIFAIEDSKGAHICRVEVEDIGPGIRSSEKEAIFEPFYRSSEHDEFKEGSGIGLAFVKELIELLSGSIEVRSPVNPADTTNPGSCFVVQFPIHKLADGAPPQEVAPPRFSSDEESVEDSRELVLLIEDNADLRTFISSELAQLFHIITASTADEGIFLARERIPDIIISDVVMPGKSGFEACRELKANSHTSHIPVILLTALRSEEHKRQAYESGADDFITKPVSSEILRLKVKNLLATERRIKDQARRQFVDETRLTGPNEAEQVCLDKVERLVTENMAEEQFDVSVLAEKMGFSRSAFYRKFSGLTDLSPAAYLKTRRLRQAAQWLAEGSKTVMEVAFGVGFSDPGYFSRVFKEEYQCSPSDFRKREVPVE